MGRKKLSPELKRSRRVDVLLSAFEYQTIGVRASQEGRKMREFMRHASLQRAIYKDGYMLVQAEIAGGENRGQG